MDLPGVQMNKNQKDAVISLIGGPYWSINKNMVKILGIETSLWLADVYSKWEYFKEKNILDKDGYFFNTQRNIEKDTTLSLYKQTDIC